MVGNREVIPELTFWEDESSPDLPPCFSASLAVQTFWEAKDKVLGESLATRESFAAT